MFFETGFGAYQFSGLFQTSSASYPGGCSTAMTKLRHVLQRNNKLQGLWFVDARDILIIIYSSIQIVFQTNAILIQQPAQME